MLNAARGVAATASTVLATAPETTPASLLCLSDAVLDLALGYLDSDSLVVCQATCRVFGSAAQNGEKRYRCSSIDLNDAIAPHLCFL